jgi:hypothetical protein
MTRPCTAAPILAVLTIVLVTLGAYVNHVAACAMFVAYYNFVWRTRHSDRSGKAGRLRPTAAMMAKVVPDLWDFERLYNEVIQYG